MIDPQEIFLEEYEEEFRYLFTVRQDFGEAPIVDCFHKIQVPSGLSEEQVDVIRVLDENWMVNEMNDDTRALKAMMTRIRFNTNMFGICMVKTKVELTREDLNQVISVKFQDKTLSEFLEEAKI